MENVSYSTGLGASDHISFSVEINCYTKYVQSNTVRANYIAAKNELSQINWEETNGMKVHGSWEFFLNKLTGCIEKHVPIANTKRNKAPWMDIVSNGLGQSTKLGIDT